MPLQRIECSVESSSLVRVRDPEASRHTCPSKAGFHLDVPGDNPEQFSNMPSQDRNDSSVTQPEQVNAQDVEHERVVQAPDLHHSMPACPSQHTP